MGMQTHHHASAIVVCFSKQTANFNTLAADMQSCRSEKLQGLSLRRQVKVILHRPGVNDLYTNTLFLCAYCAAASLIHQELTFKCK